MSGRAFAIDGVLLLGAVVAMSALALPALNSSATFTDVVHSSGRSFTTAKLEVSASGGLQAGVRGTGIANAAFSPVQVRNTGTAMARFSLTSAVPEGQALLSRIYRVDASVAFTSCDAKGFRGFFQSSPALGSPAGLPILGAPRTGADPGDQLVAPGATMPVCLRVWIPEGVGSAVTGETINPVITVHAEQVNP